jgi:hypothetical protein
MLRNTLIVHLLLLLLAIPSLAQTLEQQRAEFETITQDILNLEAELEQSAHVKPRTGAFAEKLNRLENLKRALRVHPYAEHIEVAPEKPVVAVESKSTKEIVRKATCKMPHLKYKQPDFRLPAPKIHIFKERQELLDRYDELQVAFCQHMVVCQAQWASEKKTAVEWDADRHELVNGLILTQKSLAMAYSGALDLQHFINETKELAAKKASRDLKSEVLELDIRLAELSALNEQHRQTITSLQRGLNATGLGPLLAVQNRIVKMMEAVEARKNGLLKEAHSHQKIAVQIRKESERRRIARGIEELNRALQIQGDDREFRILDKKELLRTDSPLLKDMIGDDGIQILINESAMRYRANRKRTEK